MIDWIQGEKFKELADYTYSPKIKIYPKDDYDHLPNTFNPALLKNCTVIYTHTMYVKILFDIIRHLNGKFIVITHSCDYSIEKHGVNRPSGRGKICHIDYFTLPDNVIKWYSKNINTIDPRIESIPIGLENNLWCPKIHKKEKMVELLKRPKKIKNLMYMNHSIHTNSDKREELYQLFENKSWVTSEHGTNGYKFENYIDNVYNHKFVICPEGNGMDTHRTWETLYMGTIPIEKRNINNQFYIDLPICFVDDWKEITEEFLENEYDRIKQFVWNMDKLTFEYWRNKMQIHANFMNMIHTERDNGFSWGTHQLVLYEVLKRISRSVLELGAGDFSTVQIHNILKNRGVKILTIEQEQKWLDKYKYLITDLHNFKHINDIDIGEFYKKDEEKWGLVFIDNVTWEARKKAILKYKNVANYVILHDCDTLFDIEGHPFGKAIKPIDLKKHDPGIRNYNQFFKYWIEFFVKGWKQWHPPTLLGSNKICLDDIKGIDGMIISNRN